MGYMVRNASTPSGILDGAPRISMTAAEARIAKLPGLLHYFDPGSISATLGGIDRFGGSSVINRGSGMTIAEDVSFNDLPVVTMPASSGWRIGPGTLTPSFTVSIVASRSSLAIMRLFTTNVDGATFAAMLQVTSSGALTFIPDNTVTTDNILSVASGLLPGVDEAAVWSVSWDDETKEAAILINRDVLAVDTLATNTIANDDMSWWIGGSVGGATTWLGKIGVALVADRALHRSTELPLLVNAITDLMAMNGIPG